MNPKQVGHLGEGIAIRYLLSRGYSVVERNYLQPWGEIDVVAKKDNTLHFIEVKSRTVRSVSEAINFDPYENLHEKKISALIRTIESYLMSNRVDADSEWFLDACFVLISIEERKTKVHFESDIL